MSVSIHYRVLYEPPPQVGEGVLVVGRGGDRSINTQAEWPVLGSWARSTHQHHTTSCEEIEFDQRQPSLSWLSNSDINTTTSYTTTTQSLQSPLFRQFSFRWYFRVATLSPSPVQALRWRGGRCTRYPGRAQGSPAPATRSGQTTSGESEPRLELGPVFTSTWCQLSLFYCPLQHALEGHINQ